MNECKLECEKEVSDLKTRIDEINRIVPKWVYWVWLISIIALRLFNNINILGV
jgi:hypothetical protein